MLLCLTLWDASHTRIRQGWMSSCCRLPLSFFNQRRNKMRNKISLLGSAVPLGCYRSALIPPQTLEGCYGFHRGALSDEYILTFLSNVPDVTVVGVIHPKCGIRKGRRWIFMMLELKAGEGFSFIFSSLWSSQLPASISWRLLMQIYNSNSCSNAFFFLCRGWKCCIKVEILLCWCLEMQQQRLSHRYYVGVLVLLFGLLAPVID